MIQVANLASVTEAEHGILIVEFANQLRLEGRDRTEAAIDAAVLRLRPILMTTGAMILGAVPLALATGAGAESRYQIGRVIVGGMSIGTLLTLFVVPTVYSILGMTHARLDAASETLAMPAAPYAFGRTIASYRRGGVFIRAASSPNSRCLRPGRTSLQFHKCLRPHGSEHRHVRGQPLAMGPALRRWR
jgi:hypothetical protein